MGGVLAMAARTCHLHLRALVPRLELRSARLGGRRSAGMRVSRVGLLMRALWRTWQTWLSSTAGSVGWRRLPPTAVTSTSSPGGGVLLMARVCRGAVVEDLLR
jgi:hypothetical protein